MNRIICDYTNIQYFKELQTILRDAMNWPDYYGCNLDALHDITVMEGFPDQIIFRGTSHIPADWASYWNQMLVILKADIQEYYEKTGISISLFIED